MQDWLQDLGLDTSASSEDRGCDVWDDVYCCNYQADGSRLPDAEDYPVKDTCAHSLAMFSN